MNIKEELQKIVAEIDKPRKDVNRARIASQLLALQAEIEEGKCEIAADVFDVLPPEARQACLMVFLITVAQSVVKD